MSTEAWENYIDELVTTHEVSDLIFNNRNQVNILSKGTVVRQQIPEALQDKWNDLLTLLFKDRGESLQGIPKEEFTLEGGATIRGFRFRISALKHHHGESVVMRLLPEGIPDWKTIGLYPHLMEKFLELNHGLVVLIGPTGSGKSTTIASMLKGRIDEQPENVVTIEDPVEFLYPDNEVSNIMQRQVGRDCESFSRGLRDALRQAPHVIMIGEIRDEDTAMTALQAAESGHVVVSTIHAHSVDQACQRYIKLMSSHNPDNVCDALAGTLQIAIAQRLLFNPEANKRVSVHEVMFMTKAIGAHIRSQKFERIPNELEVGKKVGQISWSESYRQRIDQGLLPAHMNSSNH